MRTGGADNGATGGTMASAYRQPAADVVIIGGGVMGCAIAYELAMRGVAATIVEQREVAASASGASAGGVRQQGRDLRELPVALKAIPRWPGLADRLGADVEYRRGGHLTVIEDEAILPAFAESVARQRAAGLDIRLVDPHGLATIMPGVAATVVAGSYTPEDGHANPILTTKAFADAAVRAGVRLIERTAMTGFQRDSTGRIVGVETTAGTLPCRWAVNAAGAWAGEVARMAGTTIPLHPACYQMLVTAPAPHVLDPVVGCVGRPLSLKQVPEGGFVVGGGWAGTVHLDNGRAGTVGAHIAGSAAACTGILPLLRQLPLLRAWSGMEGESPDGISMIGPAPDVPGLFHCCGFTGHGFAIAPEVGAVVGAWLATGTPPYEMAHFDPARFAGGHVPARVLPMGAIDFTRNEAAQQPG
jgi:sarcosine oxidase, subunit beta